MALGAALAATAGLARGAAGLTAAQRALRTTAVGLRTRHPARLAAQVPTGEARRTRRRTASTATAAAHRRRCGAAGVAEHRPAADRRRRGAAKVRVLRAAYGLAGADAFGA